MGRMFKGDNCLGGIPTALAPPLVASAKPGKKGIFRALYADQRCYYCCVGGGNDYAA